MYYVNIITVTLSVYLQMVPRVTSDLVHYNHICSTHLMVYYVYEGAFGCNRALLKPFALNKGTDTQEADSVDSKSQTGSAGTSKQALAVGRCLIKKKI